jgi:lysozyme family protein
MKGLLSPYLWSGTSLYNGGKYTADGVYNPDAIDEQLGCVVLIKRLKQLNLIGAEYGLK